MCALHGSHTCHTRVTWVSRGCHMGVTHLLLSLALGTLAQGVGLEGQAQAMHRAALAILQLQPDVLQLRDVALAQRLVLLSCGDKGGGSVSWGHHGDTSGTPREHAVTPESLSTLGTHSREREHKDGSAPLETVRTTWGPMA